MATRSGRNRKREKWAEAERQAGRPLRVPAGPVIQRRDWLRSQGMTDSLIAAKATENGYPMHQTTVTTLGKSGGNVHRDTKAGIFSVEPIAVPTKLVPATATRRLIKGMVYQGFPQAWISRNVMYDTEAHEGTSTSHANRVIVGKAKYVTIATEDRVKSWAGKLETADPLDYGISKQCRNRAVNMARSRGWVPLHCWDDDTVGDPDAFPEWTGVCGTERGYRLHLENGMPVIVCHTPTCKLNGGTIPHVSWRGLQPRINHRKIRRIEQMVNSSGDVIRWGNLSHDYVVVCKPCYNASLIHRNYPALGRMMGVTVERDSGWSTRRVN
jgi:hypothetical protein